MPRSYAAGHALSFRRLLLQKLGRNGPGRGACLLLQCAAAACLTSPSAAAARQQAGEAGDPNDALRAALPPIKDRVRWTPELHALFVAAVDSLGGPIKAKVGGSALSLRSLQYIDP